jgi:hypothetical protein
MSRGSSGSVVWQLRSLFGRGSLAGLGDGRLIERFVAHKDEKAFEALMARHGPMVLGVCQRALDDPHDVEDAFQATFLVLVKKAGTLRDIDLLANWLYGVAHRVASRAPSETVLRTSRSRPPRVMSPWRRFPAPGAMTRLTWASCDSLASPRQLRSESDSSKLPCSAALEAISALFPLCVEVGCADGTKRPSDEASLS